MKIQLHKIIHDLSSARYHSIKNTFSSSQFKDLLDDESEFIEKHINKTIPREELEAFDTGTYFHSAVLEPHNLKNDCIVFPGKIRRGAKWEIFKKKHKGKAIVTSKQLDDANNMIKAVKKSPVASEYLVGEKEVSLFTKIIIHNGRIIAPKFNMAMTKNGWEKFIWKDTGDSFSIVVKVRADNLGKTFISDLKSTTGNARSNDLMRTKISEYQYDLSAALYLDMFSLIRPELENFIWIFASKDRKNTKTYKASADNILIGRAKYMKAMLKMADCAANDWKIYDYLDVLEPMPYERDYLIEKDSDLI